MSTALAEPTTSPPAPPAPEDPLYEIVNGVRVELPPTGIYANLIASRIDRKMAAFVDEHRLGTVVTETLLILDREADLRRRPDVAFVDADRWPLDREVPETGDWDVVPTLAVEVISPHDLAGDVERKLVEYFTHGVRAVWVVHPEHRRVYCHSSLTDTKPLLETDTLDGGHLLPGFTMSLESLFRRTTGAAPSH